MGKHSKKKDKKIIFLLMLRIVFVAILIISAFNILKWYIDNKKNKALEQKLSEAIIIENTKEQEIIYKIDFEKLKDINNQAVAWLKVEGTEIEYAVVKSNDNTYYLNHNFEKEYNNAGWIFADYRNKFDGTDKNIIIYGHNRRDNSMFGTLKNVLEEEWYNNRNNHVITLVTENKTYKYQVFSVYEIENEEYYINTEFENKEFGEFINELKSRSIKDFNVEITEQNNILTLSTCGDNNKYRVVLHAVKLRSMGTGLFDRHFVQ